VLRVRQLGFLKNVKGTESFRDSTRNSRSETKHGAEIDQSHSHRSKLNHIVYENKNNKQTQCQKYVETDKNQTYVEKFAMTTLCPVCSKFESSDVVALERHIDECLSKGDEEFARSLADSESKQLAEKSKAELAASKSTKSSSNDDNNNNTANAGVSLASSATHSGPLTRSQRKKARDSFDSSSDLLLSAKKPATDSMQLDDNGNNHRNANNSKTTVADDDDDDDDFEIIQKPTSAPTNSNNSHSSATTSSAVGGARTPLKRSMQNDDDDGSDNELAEARAAQLAAEVRSLFCLRFYSSQIAHARQ
jgi:hypothetical protein